MSRCVRPGCRTRCLCGSSLGKAARSRARGSAEPSRSARCLRRSSQSVPACPRSEQPPGARQWLEAVAFQGTRVAFPGTRVSALPAPGGRGRHGDRARGNGPGACARRPLTSPRYQRPQGGAAPARGAGRGGRGRRVRAGSPILPVVSGARARPWSGAGAAAAGTEGGRREREKGARPPGPRPRPAGTARARTAGGPRGDARPGGFVCGAAAG